MSAAAELRSQVKHWLAAMLVEEGTGPPCPDTRMALELAQHEGIAALLHRRVHALGASVPGSLREGLHKAHAQAVALEVLRTRETAAVLAALSAKQLPVLVLKGEALAHWAYDDSHLRSRVDLDLLFADRDHVARAEVALAPLGYQVDGPNADPTCLQITLQRPFGAAFTWHIDAHWRLSNHPVFADRLGFEELWAESWQPADQPALRVLGKAHAFLHACIHRINNLMIGEGDRLIWLLDLERIGRHLDAGDWQRIQDLACERQLAGPCLAAMRACQAFFASSWPAAVLAALERAASAEAFDVERAHSRWYFEWSSLRSRPAGTRLGWLLRRLLPSRDYMRQRYAVQGNAALLAAYLRRWGTGLAIALRHLRKG